MKTNRQRLWNTAIVASLFLATLIGGCKKDDFVEIPGGLCPNVISTDPLSNATLVPRNQVITATFNKKMDPQSFTDASFDIQGVTKATIPGDLAYNPADSTVSFTPTDLLALATTYTCKVKATVKDLQGNVMQADYVWAFSTGPIVAPIVNANTPVNLATLVPLNTSLTATFSMPMDPATINTTTFIVNQGVTAIAGAVTYSGLIATFTPAANLLPGLVYTATITTGAQNTDGTPLANTNVWTFTTAPVVPVVTLTSPLNNATNVPLNTAVTATFSMTMNPATLTAPLTFTVRTGVTAVPGVVTYNGFIATFTPTANLLPGLVYTATITTGAQNTAGTPLASDYVWTFNTALAVPAVTLTSPLNNATNVPLNTTVAATFNMAMNPATLTAPLTFTVRTGVIAVAGVVSYNGFIATFTPNSDLLANTSYTATITTAAMNVAGTSIASNYSWNFSTGLIVVVPPIVDLGSADRFGILAGVGVSNNAGFSTINDLDVGISPGVRSSVTGFPPAVVNNGAIYASDDLAPPGTPAMLTQAKLDLTAAYLFAEGATTPAPATVSGDQGGLTLPPGIYKSTSTLLIQFGDLTLDGGGDPNATWIFQVASAFTTVGGAGGSIILSGGAQAKNIFWQTGSSAVIGDGTIFYGNVLALQSITMNTGAVATGRMLARNGSVVLTSGNTINRP